MKKMEKIFLILAMFSASLTIILSGFISTAKPFKLMYRLNIVAFWAMIEA